jgi:Ca2+-binding EF-hand superfamily protein
VKTVDNLSFGGKLMKYRVLTAALLLTGVAFWLTAKASAEPGKGGKGDRLSRMLERHPEADTNEDGVLTREEAKEFFKKNPPPRDGLGHGPGPRGFKGDPQKILETNPEADTDGDGKLSREEHRAFMEARRAEGLKELLAAHPELDKDGDGQLSVEERKAGSDTIKAFVREKMSQRILEAHPEADADGDGKLSEEEWAAVKGAGKGPGPGQHGPRNPVQWVIDNFDKVDADSDGKITKDELTQFKATMPEWGPAGHKGFGFQKGAGPKGPRGNKPCDGTGPGPGPKGDI